MSRRAGGALLIAAALASVAATPYPSRIDFLYIESNVGTASGGHTAIRFDDKIYHFQHRQGALRLVRTDADFFRYHYTVLENRSAHVARVAVDLDTQTALRHRFNTRYLTEQSEFGRLERLHTDRALLEHLLGAETNARLPVSLPGAGLFLPEQSGSEPVLVRLRQRVADVRGPDYLARRLSAFDREIQELRPEEEFSTRFAELAIDRVAVQILLGALPLRQEHVRRGEASSLSLTAMETQLLASYASALEDRLLELFDSGRADWGRPLLVGMARLVVLDASLRTGRLVVLDSFPGDARTADGESLRKSAAFLGELYQHASQELTATRTHLAQRSSLRERHYQELEEAVNRFLEYDEAQATRPRVRMDSSRLLPAAEPARIDLPLPQLPRTELEAALLSARSREEGYRRELQQSYDYDLIRRNCVTEIFRIIEGAFEADDAKQRLGGHIEIGAKLGFIPKVAFDAVLENYRVVEVGEISSLRHTRVRQMYEEENSLLVYLRETNTVTSSVYRPNRRDSLFLFFTDGAVAPRPLYGALNLVAGAAETVSGLLRLPFDGGRALVSGGRGVVFSVPELFFFNIRKGTLEYGRNGEPRTRLETAPR